MKTLIAGFVLALPVAAFAHAHLESSIPAKGSTVAATLDSVTLDFNEGVELTALKLQKVGENKARDLVPLPAHFSEHPKVPLPKLAEGDYVLSYSVQGTDTHESKGTIPFKVGPVAKPAAGGMGGMHDDCCKNRDHMKHGGDKPAAPAAPSAGAAPHEHDHTDEAK